MSTADDTAAETQPVRARLDRPVLVGNLVSGGLWLSPLSVLAPIVFMTGLVYVVAGSVLLAAVYARPVLTREQEALAWITPWIAAVALFLPE